MEQTDPTQALCAPTLKISFEKALQQVDIGVGTAITVWLHPAEGEEIQVELQVDHAGVPRILVCREDLKFVRTFEDVYG